MLSDAAIWKAWNTPSRLVLIAGPCVIESEKLCLEVVSALRRVCHGLGVFYVFKASYDKANRTSGKSFRGPGLEEGLAVLARVCKPLGVPVLTDIHTEAQATPAVRVADMRPMPILRRFGCPVIFDATHSVQLPGGSSEGTETVTRRQPPVLSARSAPGSVMVPPRSAEYLQAPQAQVPAGSWWN